MAESLCRISAKTRPDKFGVVDAKLIDVDRIRHVFRNESQGSVHYILICDVPASAQAEFVKIVPWLEKNARFSLVVVPCEIQLGLASDQSGHKRALSRKKRI
jgi:hypothetical protein